MRLQLEETLGTFNGYFFVTLYLNAAVQRVTFGYVTRTSTSNYFNFHTFVMPRRLCYSRNCQCPLQHTELILIEYSKILTIAVAETLLLQRQMLATKYTLLELSTLLVMIRMQYFNSREAMKIKNFQDTNPFELSCIRPTRFEVFDCCVCSSFCCAPSCKIM